MTELFTPDKIARLCVTGVIIVAAIALLVFLGRTKRKIRKLRKEDGRNLGRQGTLTSVGLSIVEAIVIVIAILCILEVNGIQVTSLLAGLGVASAVVGFAMQDILKDVFMGAHIARDHFYEIGDVVRYGDVEGVVTDFNLRTTKLRCIDDNNIVSISNRNIAEITKISDQVFLYIPFSYTEDTKTTQDILAKACQKAETIEGINSCTNLGLNNLNDSSVEWKIRIVCPPKNKPDLRRKALLVIYDTITEAGIKVPFNQLDVHMS